MSRGGKVEFDVASMRHGASAAGRLGHAFEESAARVAGLPMPEGTPPEIAGELRAVSASLHRAAGSAAAQRQWLRFHAQLALIADGPMAALLALLSPPLTSPFELPSLHLTKLKKPPKNPPGPDWLWKYGGDLIDLDREIARGMKDGVKSLGEGLLRTAALVQPPWVLLLQKQLKDVPLLGKPYQWNSEFAEGMKYAAGHKREFLELMGKDAIAYNDYKDGHYGHGFGRNVVDFVTLVVPVTKIAKAGAASKLAASAADAADVGAVSSRIAAQDAAMARNAAEDAVRGIARRPGESTAAFRERELAARVKWGEHEHAADVARQTASQRATELDAAKHKAEAAKHEIHELAHEIKHELKQSSVEKPNTAGQVVVAEHAHEQAEEREHREKRREH